MNRHVSRAALRIALALGAASLMFPLQSAQVAVLASGTNLDALISHSIEAVHSFKVVSDSSSKNASTSPGGVMKLHREEIFIRRGTGFAVYDQVTTDGKYNATVYTGTQYCIKRGAAGIWKCSVPPAYLKAALATMDPAQGFKASGVITSSVAPVGTKSIQGQTCTGYRFAMALKSISLTGRGTIWFSSASGRLVELDETSSARILAGSPPLITTGVVVYTRWNDASLVLPKLPA